MLDWNIGFYLVVRNAGKAMSNFLRLIVFFTTNTPPKLSVIYIFITECYNNSVRIKKKLLGF